MSGRKKNSVVNISPLHLRLQEAVSHGTVRTADFPDVDRESLAILQSLIAYRHGTESRIHSLNETLIRFTNLDFENPAPISDAEDEIDALALGLNTLSEEYSYYIKRNQQNENFLRMAQRLGRIGSWAYDVPRQNGSVSETLLEIYGRGADAFKDFKTWVSETVHPDDQALVLNAVDQARKTSKPFLVHHKTLKPDGTLAYLETRGEVVTENGVTTTIQGATIDITTLIERQLEISKLADELSDNQKQLLNAQRIGQVGSWYFDLTTETVAWSQTLHDIFGTSAKSTIDFETFKGHIHPQDWPKLQAAINACLHEGKAYTVKHRFINTRGEIGWLEGRGERITKNGKPVALNGTAYNITRMVQQEQKLKQLAKELELKVKERTEELEAFTYSVSHDLRSPLRAIQGFSSILEEEHADSLNDDAKRSIAILRKNAKKMSFLIDELLAFSRVGRSMGAFETVDLDELVSRVWTEFKESHELSDEYHFSKDTLPSISGIPGLLYQVFFNLISNSVKYSSKEKQPKIEVRYEKSEEAHLITVKDNGIGFDMEYADKLFQVFQRLHTHDEFEGIGVGLAMVKRILDKHHALIRAESAVNRGTSFILAFNITSHDKKI